MRKVLFSLLCFLLIFNVNAAEIKCEGGFSATLNIEEKNIYVGKSTKISVKDTSVPEDYKYIVSYNIENKEIADLKENNNNVAEITGRKMGETEINIEVKFLTNTNNQISKCNTSTTLKVISSDVTLKSLNTDKYDLSSVFKSDVYEYDIELPYEVEKINILAEATDANAKITGDGERYLNEGKQSFMVLINNNGEKNSYKININRLSPSSDNNLKSLFIEGYVLDPVFDSNILEYFLKVNETVDQINIKAEANNENAKISGIGKFNLISGDNKFIVKVTSQDGSDKEYVINVNKNKGTSLLNSLKVSRYKLSPKFNRFTFTYDISIYDDIDELKIIAAAKDGDKIEIIGNDKLKDGKNEIYIKVSGTDKTTSVYKINAYKYDKLKLVENIGKDQSTLTTALLIIFVISIIVTTGLIIYFVKINWINPKLKLKKKKKKRG